MKKQKLNYRFHNPNTAEVTADYILKVFIEVNAKKVERVMQEVAEKSAEEDKQEAKLNSLFLMMKNAEKGITKKYMRENLKYSLQKLKIEYNKE